MKEPLVTIPKSEYDELISIKEKFVSAFNEKKTILFHDSHTSYGMMRYMVHSFSIVNECEILKQLNDDLIGINTEKIKVQESNRKLQELHKKWYEYIPERKWYQLIPMK